MIGENAFIPELPLSLYKFYLYLFRGSSGGVVIMLLACGASSRGSIPNLASTISEIGYLLGPSRDMADISLKRRKSLKQPTNQQTNLFRAGLLYQINTSGSFHTKFTFSTHGAPCVTLLNVLHTKCIFTNPVHPIPHIWMFCIQILPSYTEASNATLLDVLFKNIPFHDGSFIWQSLPFPLVVHPEPHFLKFCIQSSRLLWNILR